jgi:hypothetical protein
MLGHKDIRTIQIYAKVIDEKGSEDMSALKENLKSKELKKRSPALAKDI